MQIAHEPESIGILISHAPKKASRAGTKQSHVSPKTQADRCISRLVRMKVGLCQGRRLSGSFEPYCQDNMSGGMSGGYGGYTSGGYRAGAQELTFKPKPSS